jgi:hypothetical protein
MILENKEIELTEEELNEELVIAKKTKKKKEVKEAKKEVAELSYEELIDSWKKEHKRIFKNEIDGEVIIWRRLKRGEYKEILKADTEEDDKILTKQELMVKAAVLYPFDVEALVDENAGLATVLSEEILAKSGFAISYTEEI